VAESHGTVEKSPALGALRAGLGFGGTKPGAGITLVADWLRVVCRC